MAAIASQGTEIRAQAAVAVEQAHAAFLDAPRPGVAELQRVAALLRRLTPPDPARRRFLRRRTSTADAFATVAAARPELQDAIFALRRSADTLRRRRIEAADAAARVEQAERRLGRVRDSHERLRDRVNVWAGTDVARHDAMAAVHQATDDALRALTPDLAVCNQAALALRTLSGTDEALSTRISEVLTSTTLAIQVLATPPDAVVQADLDHLRNVVNDLQTDLTASGLI